MTHVEVVTAPRFWVYPLPGDDSTFLGHNLLIIFPGDKQSKTEISKITLSGQSCQFDLSKWSFISIMDQIFADGTSLEIYNSEEEDNSVGSEWNTAKILLEPHWIPWLKWLKWLTDLLSKVSSMPLLSDIWVLAPTITPEPALPWPWSPPGPPTWSDLRSGKHLKISPRSQTQVIPLPYG